MTKLKKVSVYSIESVQIKNAKLDNHWESVNVTDKYFYIHILFVLLGLMHFLPYTFFITANAYWMGKFRNVSDNSLDASRRTTLQSHFASSVSLINTLTNSIFVTLSALYGYKWTARFRTLLALTIMTIGFAIVTAFVNIDTDKWQLGFFITTMIVLATINSANAALQVSVLVVLAKFPPYYLKVYLFGQGCAAVFNSILQVLTLAIGTSTTTSALMYFGLGTSFMGLTLILFFFSSKNEFFRYFVDHSEEDLTREMLSFSELKAVLRIIWPSLLMYLFYDLGNMPEGPVIALVVSEEYGSGDKWSDIYFVPVITYLFGDICTLLGRLASSANKTLGTSSSLAFSVSRVVVFLPLLILCNAQPRRDRKSVV